MKSHITDLVASELSDGQVIHCTSTTVLAQVGLGDTRTGGEGRSYPFLPPFLRDSAGVEGGEGERRLFLPAELALRSFRSGVRED